MITESEYDKEISRLLVDWRHGAIEPQKRLKRKMQQDILEVIQAFEEQTGLSVDSVSLTHADIVLATGKSTEYVRCEVVL